MNLKSSTMKLMKDFNVVEMQNKVNRMEAQLAEFEKEMSILGLNEFMNTININNNSTDFEFNENLLCRLKGAIDKLDGQLCGIRTDLNSLKNIRKRLNTLDTIVDSKLDRKEFEKWCVENDISSIVNGLTKKFADKNEVIKALRALDERIRAIEDLIREDEDNDADTAVLATKPLSNWSCASCRKNLVNLEGIQAQYCPWSKFPQHTPSDKLGKIGQGFSRIVPISKIPCTGAVQKRFLDEGEMEDKRVRAHTRGATIDAQIGRQNIFGVNDMGGTNQSKL